VLLLTEKTDEATRLIRTIQNRLHFRICDFHLHIDQDGLILLGLVRSYYEKQLVQEAVIRASRLPIAANRMIVCAK